jgi:DNA-binding NarL/FixJ family response regulator
MNAIRVMLVDDHFLMRVGLSSSIETEPDMTVVAEASTGEEALEQYREHSPDVVLMDIRLPGMSGIEATDQLCREHSAAKIIVLSTYDCEEDVFRATQAGARSYLSKNVLRPELLRTIRDVHAGQTSLPPEIVARLTERLRRPELSSRELEVLELIVKGRSNKEIAAELSISEFTVKLHVHNVLGKLKVSDRTQASTMAIQRGIVRI